MSSPEKLTGKVTNTLDTDDFGGSSARLDDPGGGNASTESTGDVMDHMGKNNLGGGSKGLSLMNPVAKEEATATRQFNGKFAFN